MSGLFGGGTQTTTPDYTGLQIQTAVNTLPMPIVWGESKLAPNVVWYNNFQISQGGSKGGGKGGLFGDSSSETTYSAAVIMAICEGPITGINQIWKNQSVYSLSELGLSLFAGATPQSVWSYLATAYPSEALAYQGTCYVCSSDYSLGDSATLDNHNFEVQGAFFGSGINGVDADPAQVVNDFLTNAQYGVGFPSASIDATTLFGSGGDASFQTYCKAVGFGLSPALTDQEQASSIFARWLQLTNTAAVWSGGLLKLIPYGDTATTAGTHVTVTQQREIGEVASGGSNPAGITVCNSAYFVSDGGVTYSNTGTPLTYIGTTWPTAAGTYGMSPAGTYLFAYGDEGTNVEITFTYQIAASFSPNLTPIYDLTDDDFKFENNEDPLQVSRSDPYEAYNVWRLEIADRDNAYNLTSVESRDQNAIELYGMRIAPTVTAHEICDTNVGLISGQLMLQRAVYIRNTYKFRLSWEYCLLDPMDLVTVTDTVLGLSRAAIRITEIEEDENGFLSVTAEEFPLGVATATLYATQSASNNPLNRAVAADPVNTPIIFEPPSALVGATAQVWIAASGGSGGVADPNWGGCNVWLSSDGTSYTQIGTIVGPAAARRVDGVASFLRRHQSGYRGHARGEHGRKRRCAGDGKHARRTTRQHVVHRRRRARVVRDRDADRRASIFADLSLSRPLRHGDRFAFDRRAVCVSQQQRDLQIRSAGAVCRPRDSISSCKASTSSAAACRISRRAPPTPTRRPALPSIIRWRVPG